MSKIMLRDYFSRRRSRERRNRERERDTEEEEDYDPVRCEISENKIMFVYQLDEMQRLYTRYAPTLVLLDATYHATKY